MAIKHNDWSLINLGKIVDVSDFIELPPWERGRLAYNKPGQVDYTSNEQIDGALARWGHPKFKRTFIKIKKIVEEVLGEKLYPTYYYDRFYFKGCELKKHTDRHACEISVSMHISTNATYEWPLYFTVNDKVVPVNPKEGEAVLYKGIDLEHWRDKLDSKYNRFQRYIKKLRRIEDDTYHHQVFFHYVKAQGNYVHHAYDRG